MANTPETLGSELIYKGKVFDIRIDEIREADVEYKREIVVHMGSVVVIPIFEDGTIALVQQYRHAAGKHLLEICAGKLERGEDPEVGARRELEEEIGVRAAKIEKLCEFYVSPGFLTEKMHVFAATGLTNVGQNLGNDELLTVRRLPLSIAIELVAKGEIEDAKSIVGLIFASDRLVTNHGRNDFSSRYGRQSLRTDPGTTDDEPKSDHFQD
jgi:ADP-ribose pyrophosphatase